MNTYEVLEKALGLIEREENWCGDRAHVGRGPGGSLCARFAIKDVAGGVWNARALNGAKALDALLDARGFTEGTPAFNDSHTHAEVVALFRKAIRQEKAKAGVPIELPTTTCEEVAA